MKLEELHEMIVADFYPIKQTDLAFESLRSNELFVKYIQLYSTENLRLSKMENDRKKLIAEKREYYSGNAKPEVYQKKPFDIKVRTDGGIQKYIDADDEVVNYDDALIIQKQKVEVLTAALDQINKRGFAIRQAIDYTKFMNGA